MARLLLTGGTGLVGGEFFRLACEAGHEVTMLSRRPVEGRAAVVADLCNPQGVLAALPRQRFDAVVYLAQADDHHGFPSNVTPAVAVNLASPLALCQWALEAGCSQFIYASSGGICGAGADPKSRITESHPRQPTDKLSFYLATKARCEELLAGFAGGIQVDLLRYFFVYGTGQKSHFLLPRLAGRVMRGEPIELAQGVGPLMNVIHATDAARLTLAAIGTAGPQITNIAGGEDVCLADLVAAIGQQVGREPAVVATEAPQPVFLADTQRMSSRLGRAAIGWREGLRTVSDFRKAA